MFSFKIATIILLFSLTAFKLTVMQLFPGAIIISDIYLLIVMLVLISYLWIKESFDRREQIELNRKLIKANEELKKAHFDTVFALFLAEEAKGPYTKGHCG